MTMTERVKVWHYDGRSAGRKAGFLTPEADGFHLSGEDWDSGPWRWDSLIAQDGPDLTFSMRDHQGWRIIFAGPPPASVAAHLPAPRRYGGFIDRIGVAKASAVLAVVAGAVLFVGLKAPSWIAPIVPQSWEDRLGDTMLGDFGGRYCHTPEGDKALRALIAKIDPTGHARSIEVANIPMVNAVALPGRHVIIFDGLLQGAESPDEVAGVLGHELGHVKHRDTLTALMRQLGLSVILGGVDGRAGAQVNALLGLSFSRDAEHQADEAAIESLRSANISPLPTARFFERMDPMRADDKGKARGEKARGKDHKAPARKASDKDQAASAAEAMSGWFASHPSSHSRMALFEKAAEKNRTYAPALDAAQWKALKDMCGKDKKVKSGWNFGL